MIKFFRQIRQTLIMENKTSKYLKYAIGEIVLVVIGILIALQVNNWNTLQNEKKKEQVYLKKLMSNLKDDIALLNEIIQSDSLMFKSLNKISNDILIVDDVKKLDFSGNSRFKVHLFYPNKTTFDNLVSSGQIDLIRNDSIIDKLLLYYRSITIIGEGTDTSLKNYSRDIEHFFVGFDHVKKNSTLSTKNIEDYRKEPFILNSFYYKNGLLRIQINNYKNLISEAELILDIITKELND